MTNQGTVWATDLPHRWAVGNARTMAPYWDRQAELYEANERDYTARGMDRHAAYERQEARKARAEAARYRQILADLLAEVQL